MRIPDQTKNRFMTTMKMLQDLPEVESRKVTFDQVASTVAHHWDEIKELIQDSE